MKYDPSRGLLAGMQTSGLQKSLAEAQQAYIELSSGKKGVSFTYAQGDGSRSVTYTETNLPALANLIQTLQAQLGVVARPRRAIRFGMR
jgi:gpW